MAKLRHFATMTIHEQYDMAEACKSAAIDYATKIGLSGLSEGGSHNVYLALETAIRDEWTRAGDIRIRNGRV